MKIAIAVQGRFHAFDLAKALVNGGHDVTVFTNYPKWAVKRFGFPTERVRSFWMHAVISRIAYRLQAFGLWPEPDRWLHPMFGQWISTEISQEQWDAVHGWSGVSEEYLGTHLREETLKLIMRGSAHILEQSRILEEEEARTGHRLDRPGPWIKAREQREYQLADRIVVLSTFALQSFLEEGCEPTKLCLLPLGTDTAAFRPGPEIIADRCRRILSGAPLRVLYVGNMSYQKGIQDMAEIIKSLPLRRFHFQLVGNAMAETRDVVASLAGFAEFVPRRPHEMLPESYAYNDLFLFPTIQDGFAVVLAQAQASGLPILTTTNCCGPDLVKEGETGWVLPIRSPEAFAERLLWCDSHREVLAEMVRRSHAEFRPRDWDDVAADFEALCKAELAAKKSSLAAEYNGR